MDLTALPTSSAFVYHRLMDSTIKLIASDMGGVLALHSDHGLESRLLEDFGLSRYRSFAELDPRLPALLFDHSKNLDRKSVV